MIVLFDSACPLGVGWTIPSTNMLVVYANLVDRFEGIKVNGYLLKLSLFDACKFTGNNTWFILENKVRTIELRMFYHGKELDRRRGGPRELTQTRENVEAMSAWIDSNLLDKPHINSNGEKVRVVFNGSFAPVFEPYGSKKLPFKESLDTISE